MSPAGWGATIFNGRGHRAGVRGNTFGNAVIRLPGVVK